MNTLTSAVAARLAHLTAQKLARMWARKGRLPLPMDQDDLRDEAAQRAALIYATAYPAAAKDHEHALHICAWSAVRLRRQLLAGGTVTRKFAERSRKRVTWGPVDRAAPAILPESFYRSFVDHVAARIEGDDNGDLRLLWDAVSRTDLYSGGRLTPSEVVDLCEYVSVSRATLYRLLSTLRKLVEDAAAEVAADRAE